MGDRLNDESIHSITPGLARNRCNSNSGTFYFYVYLLLHSLFCLNNEYRFFSLVSASDWCIKYETKTFPSSQIWDLSNFGNGVPNAMAQNDSNEPIKNVWMCLGPIVVNSLCSDGCEMVRFAWIDAPWCFHRTFPNVLNASKNRSTTVVVRRTIVLFLLFALNAQLKMKN